MAGTTGTEMETRGFGAGREGGGGGGGGWFRSRPPREGYAGADGGGGTGLGAANGDRGRRGRGRGRGEWGLSHRRHPRRRRRRRRRPRSRGALSAVVYSSGRASRLDCRGEIPRAPLSVLLPGLQVGVEGTEVRERLEKSTRGAERLHLPGAHLPGAVRAVRASVDAQGKLATDAEVRHGVDEAPPSAWSPRASPPAARACAAGEPEGARTCRARPRTSGLWRGREGDGTGTSASSAPRRGASNGGRG